MKLTNNFDDIEFRSGRGPKMFRAKLPPSVLVNVRRLAVQLQKARDLLGPLRVTTGYRSPTHNKRVGGVPNSHHLTGDAADIVSKTLSPNQLGQLLYYLAKSGYLDLGEVGVYTGHVHVSTRGKLELWRRI